MTRPSTCRRKCARIGKRATRSRCTKGFCRAKNSPMPPAELAETGVYCTGDDCHKIRAKWERPIADVTPPRSSVEPVWTVAGFGSGKGSGGANAPIHFGDTQPAEAKRAEAHKSAVKAPAKVAPKKTVKAAPQSASRKARR